MLPVDGKVEQEDCAECHDPPWIIPSANELFTNKNAVQLCRKMKEFGGAASFLRHVRTDDFSVVGFAGTRGLNTRGQSEYEEKRKAPYEKEPPKFAVDELATTAQAWVNAMGGRWVMDSDCGCMPHHYSLSIDEKSNDDSSSGSYATHMEMSSHTDIPLKFKDDGSFEADAQMLVTETGYDHGLISMHTGKREDCTINGSVTIKFKLKGAVEEAKPILHLVSSNGSMGESGTATCSDGTTTTGPLRKSATPGSSWDMPSFVGVDHVIPMPGQNPPQFTSSMKCESIRRIDLTPSLCRATA